MNDDEIKDDAEELDPDAVEAEDLVEEETGDLPIELAGKKRKDLLDEDTESLEDLAEDEEEEEETFEDVDLM